MNKVYDYVKDNIITKVEEAIANNEPLQWIKPWSGYIRPMNFKTGKEYRGINLFTLPLGGYYLTRKQVVEKKGNIKKGAKAHAVYFWMFKDAKNSNEDGNENDYCSNEKSYAIFKYYKVFHQSDIGGINFPTVEESYAATFNTSGDFILSNYRKIVKIKEFKGAGGAYYDPISDNIVLPDITDYSNSNEYYSTAFHEIVHSTGHSSRLDRGLTGKTNKEKYSKEELVAELGASLLNVYSKTNDENVEQNSIAYLKGWLSYLKEEKGNEIAKAAQKAQKAYDFIIDTVIEESLSDMNIA